MARTKHSDIIVATAASAAARIANELWWLVRRGSQIIWWLVKKISGTIWGAGPWLVRVFGALAIILAIVFFFLDTTPDVAYRYSAPGSSACNIQRDNETALASLGVKDDNNELSSAISSKIRNSFTCMLQVHSLMPGADDNDCALPGNPSRRYYLSFVEFKESGDPVEKGVDGSPINPSQMAVLLDHLKEQTRCGRQNFVVAFIHGWRHDASIGDENVKNVRSLAAYLANFLQQRCEDARRYCKATVTAVFMGWRGARLHETTVVSSLGSLGELLASLTLFDRKPVSEQIAPAVISALRMIDRTINYRKGGDDERNGQISNWFDQPRLITIGHSLGGNVLAYGLKQQMVDIVERKGDFDKIEKKLAKPPFGDLILLLNPASEAENWIAIQRAFHRRIDVNVTTKAFQNAYSRRQPPIYMSLTAAHYWPANDVRDSDVLAIIDAIKQKNPAIPNPKGCVAIRTLDSEYRPEYSYDSATYNLFPLYKFDFRPIAKTIEEWAKPDPFECKDVPRNQGAPPHPNYLTTPSPPNFIMRFLARTLSAFLRNFPFMNTDVTETRTIGNLDPMRAPFAQLFKVNANGDLITIEGDPATWFGTTHELIINIFQEKEEHPGLETYKAAAAPYADAALRDKSECAVIDNWLWIARTERATEINHALVNWDSGFSSSVSVQGKIVPGQAGAPNLTKIRPRPDNPNQHVESQIRQTLFFSGMRDVVGANDPFWNVRAFESAMIDHNGYMSYPLMCTIFQFVMDDIAEPNPEVPRFAP